MYFRCLRVKDFLTLLQLAILCGDFLALLSSAASFLRAWTLMSSPCPGPNHGHTGRFESHVPSIDLPSCIQCCVRLLTFPNIHVFCWCTRTTERTGPAVQPAWMFRQCVEVVLLACYLASRDLIKLFLNSLRIMFLFLRLSSPSFFLFGFFSWHYILLVRVSSFSVANWVAPGNGIYSQLCSTVANLRGRGQAELIKSSPE